MKFTKKLFYQIITIQKILLYHSLSIVIKFIIYYYLQLMIFVHNIILTNCVIISLFFSYVGTIITNLK